MNYLIIGQSVIDVISEYGKQEKKPGGIHYSVLAFNGFAESDDEIFLCSSLSKKDEHLFENAYKNINKRFVKYVDKIPTVNLTIYDDKEREETYSIISQSLELPDKNINRFDGIFINMVSGFDITPGQLKSLREKYTGLIYFDVHTLARGVDKNMKRVFRKIPDFNSWAKNIDVIQANEKEIYTLSDRENKIEIIEEMFACGIKIFILTMGELGLKVFFTSNGNIISEHIPSIKINSINRVGCGDVFGAVFFINYIRNKDVIRSSKLANISAGVTTTYSNIADYKNLKQDVLKRFSEE